jgi:hypothetical protein
MKYIISESRINQIIFAYLDSLNMVKVKEYNLIYIVENKDGVLMYNFTTRTLNIYKDFFDKIQLMFGLDSQHILNILSLWVEDFLGVEIDYKHIFYRKYRNLI